MTMTSSSHEHQPKTEEGSGLCIDRTTRLLFSTVPYSCTGVQTDLQWIHGTVDTVLYGHSPEQFMIDLLIAVPLAFLAFLLFSSLFSVFVCLLTCLSFFRLLVPLSLIWSGFIFIWFFCSLSSLSFHLLSLASLAGQSADTILCRSLINSTPLSLCASPTCSPSPLPIPTLHLPLKPPQILFPK
ncbi:uncharacterized protein BDW47DRAFT_92583 [Aspergillus candidus]|uniref:Uncharacterized protein n=1 Tax=Aspergillus candidus TaxID=41067 RepID=A0A2I2FHQ2_ASPCN|nr:hypothetical protein BDW47DRAFT_92583 [Aspergillus candidus]PLB40152.1 hypothetical protein BDW47DRAFT_92583 [Aspergillus candidus]